MMRFSFRLPRPARLLLAAHGCYLPLYNAAEVFVATYIMALTHDLTALVPFRLAAYALVPFVMAAIARALVSGKLLLLYRVGFAATAAFFVTLTLVPREVFAAYLVPFGLLYGVTLGLYWLPYHLYKMSLTERGVRHVYLSSESVVAQIAGIAVPFGCGYLIHSSHSYLPLFALCAALAALGFIAAERMESHRAPRAYRLHLRSYLRSVCATPELRNFYLSVMLGGIGLWGTLSTLMRAVIYGQSGSELTVGALSSFFPLVSLVSALLVRRVPHRWYAKLMLVVGVLLSACSLILISHVDVRTVTIYGAAVAFLSPFFAVMHSVITHNLIDRNEELAHSTAEHFLTLEFSLAVGRSVGLALLLPLSGMGGDTPALKIVFLLISLSSIGVALAVQRMARAVAAHAGAHH